MTMESDVKTDFLIPETDFATGMGSVASVYGKYYDYNYSETGAEADAKALYNDWRMVGKDILNAILILGKTRYSDE